VEIVLRIMNGFYVEFEVRVPKWRGIREASLDGADSKL
jgi:hypothetical protein